jgi:hypothetical protein
MKPSDWKAQNTPCLSAPTPWSSAQPKSLFVQAGDEKAFQMSKLFA